MFAEILMLVNKDLTNVVPSCVPGIKRLSGKNINYAIVKVNFAAQRKV